MCVCVCVFLRVAVPSSARKKPANVAFHVAHAFSAKQEPNTGFKHARGRAATQFDESIRFAQSPAAVGFDQCSVACSMQ